MTIIKIEVRLPEKPIEKWADKLTARELKDAIDSAAKVTAETLFERQLESELAFRAYEKRQDKPDKWDILDNQ